MTEAKASTDCRQGIIVVCRTIQCWEDGIIPGRRDVKDIRQPTCVICAVHHSTHWETQGDAELSSGGTSSPCWQTQQKTMSDHVIKFVYRDDWERTIYMQELRKRCYNYWLVTKFSTIWLTVLCLATPSLANPFRLNVNMHANQTMHPLLDIVNIILHSLSPSLFSQL